jgi:hypothetical protein
MLQLDFIMFFLMIMNIVMANEAELSNNNNNNKRIINDNNEIKHMITNKYMQNLCPIEYKSCKCDYETLNTNNLYSIAINCQHEFVGTTKKPYYLPDKLSSISRINVTNYNYISSIRYLDLSRTLIREIPSDAFHVSLRR